MRKTLLFCCFLTSFALFGQDLPSWMEVHSREAHFPPKLFFTGYSFGQINPGESMDKATERIKTAAQSDLIENLRVVITSKTTFEIGATNYNDNYNEYSIFNSSSEKSASVEITGMKVESYFDKATKYIHAFAYTNKYELIGYYKSSLAINLTQVESLMQTAIDLEAGKEKAKARQQCDAAKLLLDKVHATQDLLAAIDANISSFDLQQTKTESLYNQIVQMQARLAQGTYIYMESNEDLFGERIDLVANKLKAELAVNGCSFTDEPAEADFRLHIKATTRISGNSENIVFCYADVAVDLYDLHKQKTVFSDEFSQKGGSNSQEKAGRKAMNDVIPKITEKLKEWIK